MKCTKCICNLENRGNIVLTLRVLGCLMAILLCFSGSQRAWSNDAAAESAAGGLQLRDERRVSIIKERLQIGKRFIHSDPTGLPNLENRYSVVVEYEFLNESAQDVTTDVAFPLPELHYPGEDLIQDRKVHGFKVEVDGKRVPYATQVRAKAEGRDVTDLLREARIDIKSFGHFHHNADGSNDHQVLRLSKEMQTRLKTARAVDDGLNPNWTVAVTYHWKQTFPAGKIVKVKHEYNAIPGFSYGPDVNEYLSSLKDGCFDTDLMKALKSAHEQNLKPESGRAIYGDWVKYILTTANTWKGPIREFELIVEKPAGEFVSFCWEGKVEKPSKTRFRATTQNFVPKKELVIYFLSVGK